MKTQKLYAAAQHNSYLGCFGGVRHMAVLTFYCNHLSVPYFVCSILFIGSKGWYDCVSGAL